MRPGALSWLQRALLALGQLALLLPFVVVQDCSTQVQQAHTGWQVYGQAPGLVGLGLTQGALALVLALWAWRGTAGAGPMDAAGAARAAAGLGLRGAAGAICAVIACMAPVYAFLFDGLSPRVGWLLHAGSWLVLALAWTAGAGRGAVATSGQPTAVAERWAMGLVWLSPFVAGLLHTTRQAINQGEVDVSEALSAGALGLATGLPLVLAVRGVGVLAAATPATAAPGDGLRRGLTWLGVLAWLGLWGTAALS